MPIVYHIRAQIARAFLPSCAYADSEVIAISYLSDLTPGETAFIYTVSDSPLRERLYELGFVGGTRVECVARAAFGGPSAYLVRGSVIALRKCDARAVGVHRMPAASHTPKKVRVSWD